MAYFLQNFLLDARLYQRAKHGFWLFAPASLGTIFFSLVLSQAQMTPASVRLALLSAPLCAFALGSFFPFSAFERPAAASFSGFLLGAGLCSGFLFLADARFQAAWDAPTPWIIFGSGLAGALWGIACHLSTLARQEPSTAFLRVRGAADGFIQDAFGAAQACCPGLGAPTRLEITPQGSGIIHFEPSQELVICIEDEAGFERASDELSSSEDPFCAPIDPSPPEDTLGASLPSLETAPESPGGEPSYLITLAWQPRLSLMPSLRARSTPLDPLALRGPLAEALSARCPGLSITPLG